MDIEHQPGFWNKLSGFLLPHSARAKRRWLLGTVGLLVTAVLLLGLVWSQEPAPFSVSNNVADKLALTGNNPVTGAVMTATLITVAETMLNKPGGYLSNDVMPPGVYLDNIPNWEFGVLVQVRDLVKSMRESFSRSQSQSTEDPDLIISEPRFSVDSASWLFPAAESEYQVAIDRLYSYLGRISDEADVDAQFYARADNLANYLVYVESRLGSFSQRLSASVGQQRVNTNGVGDSASVGSTPTQSESTIQTPWLKIDDVFYEARGATWALTHFLKAAELDFKEVLANKNATASLRQIIRELEASQRPIFFPVILNGSGFGVFANHSLTMANYISRANAAIIDLRRLLEQG